MNLARNIFTTIMARVLVTGLALVSSMMIARILGPENRGLLALILLLPEFANSVGLLGFDQANTVFAGLEPQSGRKLVWHSVPLAAIIGGLVLIGGVIYAKLGAPGLPDLRRVPSSLYLISLATVPFVFLTECWGSIIRGTNRIGTTNLLEVGRKVASLAIVLLFIAVMNFQVKGAVWADWIQNFTSVIIIGAMLWKFKLLGKPTFEWDLFRRTCRFALPAYASTILGFLNYRVDQIFVAAMLPAEQLGYYVLAVGLAERLWMPTGAVANALLPHLTNSPDGAPGVSATIARHFVILTGLACGVVFIFSNFIVKLLYSSQFLGAISPLRWILPGVMTLTMAKVLVAELLARKRADYNVRAASVAAALNIIGNLVLIPKMGISGAALASTVSYTVLSIMVTVYFLRETGLPWRVFLPTGKDLRLYRDVFFVRGKQAPQEAP
jgi:O-antigen/teichoic acid export membrane protein